MLFDGSEPRLALYSSLISHFRIDFSSNFHVFSEPPSRGHFGRVKVPTYTQKCDLGAILDPGGVQKSIPGTTFSAKKTQKVESPVRRGASRSWPCRDLAPKTLQGRIWIDLGSFWDRFCMDFMYLLILFGYISCDLLLISDVIFDTIEASMFSIMFGKRIHHKPTKPENITNPQDTTPQNHFFCSIASKQTTFPLTYNILFKKYWPGGMRVSD